MQIGGRLKSGQPHDGRAPDYDDWTLNCDILFWHKPLDCALELSSMGIRVDADALRRQLDAAGCPQRAELPFHNRQGFVKGYSSSTPEFLHACTVARGAALPQTDRKSTRLNSSH